MEMKDLILAFWGRLELRMHEYGFSSLRQFCVSKNLNYQVVAAARRKMDFPSLEDTIMMCEYLDANINELIYGEAVDEIGEKQRENGLVVKDNVRRSYRIIESMKTADPIRIAAVEMILGIYSGKEGKKNNSQN